MQTVLRALRFFAMVAWVGGLIFFAFVVAPVAFHSLPSTHEAGIVVGGALRVLHWIGLIGGALFLCGDRNPLVASGGFGAGWVCDSTDADGNHAGGDGLLSVQDSAGDGS